jgi:hypothetical protein
LFKKDLRNHLLVIDFDHTIYDGMSGEILERNLLGLYRLREKNQEIRQPKPQPYSNYIQQILKGPQDISQDELVTMFELEEFCESKRKFETIIQEKDRDQTNRFFYELGFPGGITGENAWKLAFFAFNLFLKRSFGSPGVPVKIVSYGRRYGQSDFFDTVGAFLDIVPVLVQVNEKNPANMIENALDKINKAAKHNINFMSLMYGQSLKEKWKTAIDFIIPEQLPVNDMLILFNFVGKTTEEEMQALKQHSTNTAKKVSKISSFHAEVYYTSRALYFIISTSLDIEDTFAGIKISAEELKRITKKSEGV